MKGLKTLLEAMQRIPGVQVRLDAYCLTQDPAAASELAQIRKHAASDSRIQFLEPVPATDVVSVLGQYDVLAVPSLCLETGPLVVYEAFAARVPVIGSRLGGIAELVTHEKNGFLVERGDVDGWARAFERLVREPGWIARLRAGIPLPRTMETVAREMDDIYAAALGRRVLSAEACK